MDPSPRKLEKGPRKGPFGRPACFTRAVAIFATAWCGGLVPLVSPVPASGAEAQTDLVPHVRVEASPTFLPIPDAEMSCPVGRRLPLFQKNLKYYVAVIEDEYEGNHLCAFPRLDEKGQGTAWVTRDGELIFGLPTKSCKGRIYFRKGEEWEIVDETPDHYRVRASEPHAFELNIPRKLANIRRVELAPKPAPPPPEPEAVAETAPATPAPATKQSHEAQLRDAVVLQTRVPDKIRTRPRTSSTSQINLSGDRENSVAPFVNITFLPPAAVEDLRDNESPEKSSEPDVPSVDRGNQNTLPPLETIGLSEPEPAEDAARDSAAAQPGEEIPEVVQTALEPVPDAAPPEPPPVNTARASQRGGLYAFLKFVDSNKLYLQLLLAVILIQAFYIAWYRRQQANAAPPSQAASKSFDTVDKPHAAAYGHDEKKEEDAGVFSGSLTAISLGELVQFLHSASETGKLTINDASDPATRELYFHSGQITDARHAHKDGEEAVRLLLAQKKGNFAFVRQDTPPRNSAITRNTMALLLEAHRVMDESGAVA